MRSEGGLALLLYYLHDTDSVTSLKGAVGCGRRPVTLRPVVVPACSRGHIPGPRWMPDTEDSTRLCGLCFLDTHASDKVRFVSWAQEEMNSHL